MVGSLPQGPLGIALRRIFTSIEQWSRPNRFPFSASFTLGPEHAGGIVYGTSGSATTVTVPLLPQFDGATQIGIIQMGAGTVSVAAGAGVTVDADPGLDISGQYQSATLVQLDESSWVLLGSLA